jgi:hypothetical protein
MQILIFRIRVPCGCGGQPADASCKGPGTENMRQITEESLSSTVFLSLDTVEWRVAVL